MLKDGVEVHYDPMDLATSLDPFPAYALLRELAPAYHNEEHDFWAISRYDDVRSASQDWETFTSAQGVELDFDADELFGEAGGSFIAMDPPRHDTLRHVVRRSFTPKAVAELETMVRSRATELIEQSLEADVVDVARDLAQPLPTYVVNRMLGLPDADDQLIASWIWDLFLRTPGERGVPEESRAAAHGLRAYLAEEGRVDQAAQQSELTLGILDAQADGVISRSEAIDILVLLLAAGIKTTSGLIGHLLFLLADHPDQRALLFADRSLIPAAIEETLRYDSPGHWLTRVTTTDVDVAGTTIPMGARVLLLFASANRDDRKFSDADVFDIARPSQRQLAFGNGIHFCIGAPIARLEARVMLEVLLEHVRDFEVAGPVHSLFANAERELSTLPMRFIPA